MRASLRLLRASPSILLAVSMGCLLPSQGVAADLVQITCKTVSGDLDPTVDYAHSLELKQIRFLRAPTPDEVAGVNASLSWKAGENFLKPSSVAPAPKPPAPAVPKEFEQIRPVNLEYLSHLPNFIADEVAVRTH